MELTNNNETLSKQEKNSLSVLLLSNNTAGQTLLQYLFSQKDVGLFLRLMGVMWYTNGTSAGINILQCVWSAIIRLGLLIILMCGMYDIVESMLVHPSLFVLYFLFGVTVVCQSCALLFALREMTKRLLRPVGKYDSLCVESSLTSAYWVLLLSILIGCVPLGVSLPLSPHTVTPLIFIGLAGEISISCILTASLYFILTDCKVCLVLLNDMIKQQEQHTLTIEQYAEVKEEIDSRHSDSFWVNSAIVFVAILDIVTVITIIFMYSYDGPVVALVCCAVFLKEIPFLLVVYWQVAQVNEKSSLLTKLLGRKQWDKEIATDYQRVSILVSALSSPISYSLAGMKLKRKDLMWQAFAWFIAFIISIVKSVIENRI